MKKINRRAFLKASAVTAGGLALPTIIPSSVLGQTAPSNTVVFGCIGVGGQGRGNMNAFMLQPDARVVAVCDVGRNNLNQARDEVNAKYGNKDCKAYSDFREVLARKDIDAVTICTPDHWHGLIAMAAARAGKDIYCEKPLTNTIAEGIELNKICRRYGTVLQTGSHERSQAKARYACEVVRNGKIGKLHTMIVNLPCTQEHHLEVLNDTKDHPTMPVPEELDWNFWLGPAPMVPYTYDRYRPLGWRFLLEYGSGEMGDRGAHVIDLAQLGNGTDKTTALQYRATGRLTKSKLYNAFFDYNFECVYENGVKIIGTHDEPRGIKYIGDEGWIFVHIHGGNLEASNESLLKLKFGPNDVQLGRSPGHHRNFLDCLKTREEPMAPVYVGHHTATMCHLLNISMQLDGATLTWDPKEERITNNPQAQHLLTRNIRLPWHI